MINACKSFDPSTPSLKGNSDPNLTFEWKLSPIFPKSIIDKYGKKNSCLLNIDVTDLKNLSVDEFAVEVKYIKIS